MYALGPVKMANASTSADDFDHCRLARATCPTSEPRPCADGSYSSGSGVATRPSPVMVTSCAIGYSVMRRSISRGSISANAAGTYISEQVGQSRFQLRDAVLELSHPVRHAAGDRRGHDGTWRGNRLGLFGDQLLPPLFFLSDLAIEKAHEL